MTRQDTASYFLELARWPDNNEEKEDLPSELNTITSSGGFVVVSTDKLSAKYSGSSVHRHDVGVVQANFPSPVKRLFYYFEMTVKSSGEKAHTAIGFTPLGYFLRRHPGWEENSYGYHGDDGYIYRGSEKGEAFGPSFTTGDTVGGGINYASQEIFFTKNGQEVGKICKDVMGPLFPTISVHGQNEEVSVNFGKDQFVYSLKAYEAGQRQALQLKFESTHLLPNISYTIVRSYLLHYGYEETVNSLDQDSKLTIPPNNMVQENGFNEEDIGYALSQRGSLRQLIRNGEIGDAFSRLREWYPQIIQDDQSVICFLLHCQKFIELVRAGELEEAVKYGRVELLRYVNSKEYKELVQDCVSLLAYEQPQKCPSGFLLEAFQREIVADSVNAMILSTNPNLKDSDCFLQSCLEKLLRQLTACSMERRSLSENQGEAFNLNTVLNPNKNVC